MATKKKMLQAAAGNATAGGGLDIDEVFSTYLYTGTGSAQTITNGIDLDGEGGLVWIKMRDTSTFTARQYHFLYDTERGAGKRLSTNLTDAEAAFEVQELNPFNANGFSLGSSARTNETSKNYASWTFRKAPKFFDVVTYTGDGTTGRTVSHNLGVKPAFMIVKKTSGSKMWCTYHKDLGATKYMAFDAGAASESTVIWNNTEPTSTEFTVGYTGFDYTNGSGDTYVAYLFAHNDSDGEFGPNGDQDIIKCGSYTGTAPEIDLGFEPQWILIKNASLSSTSSDWMIVDTMRGLNADGENSVWLKANESTAEDTNANAIAPIPTPTGFRLTNSGSTAFGGNNSDTYIYIAIRRGPLAPPESATEVFKASLGDSTVPGYDAPFAVDMAFNRYKVSTAGNNIYSRLTGPETLDTSSTATAGSDSSGAWDYMDGWYNGGRSSDFISWMWKRAPGFFDVVAYTGNATAGREIAHNLGVAPELMIAKTRDAANYWVTYDAISGPTKFMILNQTNGTQTSIDHWNNTAPTSSVFTVGDGNYTNRNATQQIIYLFASLPGISKVGSYTGTGSGVNQDIDCGFTSGARFVLLKRTNNTGDWVVFDTERGIVVGNDGRLKLNSTEAETFTDQVDPYSGGFSVTAFFNNLNDEYIFYAIA